MPLFHKIENLIHSTATEIEALKREISTVENDNVEEKVTQLINSYVTNITAALNGTTLFNVSANGFTLEEEKKACNCLDWPNYALDLPI